MRLFTGQKKRLAINMLVLAVAEEAPSMPAAKKNEKVLRKEKKLAVMEQAMGGGKQG